MSKKLQSWSHLLNKSLKGDFIFVLSTAGGKFFQASFKNLEGSYLQEQAVMTGLDYPVATERKLNVHETSKRRPRRLLNVLCTFNLRPVPTEKFFMLEST